MSEDQQPIQTRIETVSSEKASPKIPTLNFTKEIKIETPFPTIDSQPFNFSSYNTNNNPHEQYYNNVILPSNQLRLIQQGITENCIQGFPVDSTYFTPRFTSSSCPHRIYNENVHQSAITHRYSDIQNNDEIKLPNNLEQQLNSKQQQTSFHPNYPDQINKDGTERLKQDLKASKRSITTVEGNSETALLNTQFIRSGYIPSSSMIASSNCKRRFCINQNMNMNMNKVQKNATTQDKLNGNKLGQIHSPQHTLIISQFIKDLNNNNRFKQSFRRNSEEYINTIPSHLTSVSIPEIHRRQIQRVQSKQEKGHNRWLHDKETHRQYDSTILVEGLKEFRTKRENETVLLPKIQGPQLSPVLMTQLGAKYPHVEKNKSQVIPIPILQQIAYKPKINVQNEKQNNLFDVSQFKQKSN